MLYMRLSTLPRPPSVHATNDESRKLSASFSSRGFMVCVSGVLPGLTQKASGSPSASMNSPSCTMGLGRCSLECPYLRRSSSPSVSK